MAAATLASRVMGLARDIVIANVFAVGVTDAFFIAFMIPNLFRRLVGEGALTVSFVPIFTRAMRESPESARRLFRATWTIGALVGIALVALGIAGADPLVRLFAPGFAVEPGKHELTVMLLRLCFPYIGFLVLVSVAMGALNASGHFFAPAAAPILLNLCLIGGALVAARVFEPPVLALGWAVIAAGLLQVLLQIGPLRRHGLAPCFTRAPSHPGIRRLGALMVPAALGASVYQLNLVISRVIGSSFGDGAVSYLYYASRLLEFPLGVFVFAIGMASLPSFSRLAGDADGAGLRSSFRSVVGLNLALCVPATVGLIVLREPIFAVLFSVNESVFGPEAIQGCAEALLWSALGLVPIALARVYVNLCVAHEDTATGARGAVVGLFTNVLASLLLVGPIPAGGLPGSVIALQHRWFVADFGFAGLALASSLAAVANALYVMAAVRIRYGRVLRVADWLGWGRIGLASAGMGIALGVLDLVAPVPLQSSLVSVLSLVSHVLGGAAVFAVGLLVLGSPEIRALQRIALRLVRRAFVRRA